MKNRFMLSFFVLSFCLITQCINAQTSITLTNTFPGTSPESDRINEIVEISLSQGVYESLSTLALYDDKNNIIPYQKLPYDNKIVFQASVKAGETLVYTLKAGVPASTEAKTYAAIMKTTTRGDIAWENDRSAYRMYNKILLSSEPNSANGVDLWVKKMSQPIVEKMYNYADYHSEKPEGVDAYSVGGKTLGVGGVAAYVNNKLWLHDPFDECEIIANGPLRAEFVLTYKKVLIDGDLYTKTVRVTTNANGLLNKAVVKFEGRIKPMKIAAGIFLHTNTNGNGSFGNNILAYAENKSEGTVTSPNARFYTGVYMPGETTTVVVDNQRILYADYAVGSEFTYYFGGGWNIFPVGEYTKDEDWFTAVNQFAAKEELPLLQVGDVLPTKKEVINTGIKVNNYWISNNVSNLGNNLWARSVYNMGNIDFYKTYSDPAYLKRAIQWAQSNNWAVSGGPATSDADNHTAGQTYIDLYLMDKEGERDEDKIKAIKAALDYRIANNPKSDDWWWIDAMLMAMPTFTRLGNLYDDTKYYDKMYELFSNIRNKLVVTSRTNLWPQEYRNQYGTGPLIPGYEDQGEGLYNEEDHLWWRDWGFQPLMPPKKDPNNSFNSDVPKLSPSGKNIYWSRGNGWVLAAMARTLDLLPETDPHRNEYLEIFTQMSAALKDIQREDGFWNMNLADDTHFPGQETSGTALFTYGIAWGINKGILNKETYYPIVAKGWNGLCKDAVTASGKLINTQNVGEGPIDPARLASNVDFGIGAFLLATTEVVKLASGEMPVAPEPPAISLKSATPVAKRILVEFDEDLDPASAVELGNYDISGGVVISKISIWKSNSVMLNLNETLPYGRYTLTVNNIMSYAGESIEDNSSMTFVFTVPMSDIQPEITITAIGYQTNPSNPPGNVMDKKLDTRWSQRGQKGQWIKFDLGKEVMVNAVDIAFYLGDQRISYFDIDTSLDDETFTPVLSELTSSGLTLEMERYAFEPVKARYVRIVCNSNSAGGEHWNSITEVRIRYTLITGAGNVQTDSGEFIIYPNPVTDGQFIVDLNEKGNKEMVVSIFDTKGNSIYNQKMSSSDGRINIKNIRLQSGMYILTIEDKDIQSKTFLVK